VIVRPPRSTKLQVKLQGPRAIIRGQAATYTAMIHNPTKKAAYGITIRALLAPAFNVIGLIAGGRVGASQVVWQVPKLSRGRTRTVHIKVRLARSAPRRVCVAVRGQVTLRHRRPPTRARPSTGSVAADPLSG
jgi:hypothetical protein